ncbi:hypothetical protein MMC34_008449 [Xylographa carneopallida]|nr:hypothetical protein [Xylographa carneopallida]
MSAALPVKAFVRDASLPRQSLMAQRQQPHAAAQLGATRVVLSVARPSAPEASMDAFLAGVEDMNPPARQRAAVHAADGSGAAVGGRRAASLQRT